MERNDETNNATKELPKSDAAAASNVQNNTDLLDANKERHAQYNYLKDAGCLKIIKHYPVPKVTNLNVSNRLS